jgi:hypothetical protein
MLRKIKKSYAVFAAPTQIQKEQFRSLLQKGNEDTVFDQKFFEMVDRRRGEFGKLQQTLFFLQVPTFVYLVLVLAGIDVNLSLLGITAGKNLREALVLISSALGLWASLISSQKMVLESMLHARNEKLARGNKETIDFLDAGYGLLPFVWSKPADPNWSLSRLHIVSAVILVVAVILFFVALLAVVLTVHVMTLIEIYRHPNFSFTATIVVISFVTLVDVISLSWTAISSGILPYRSRERINRLAKLMDSDPDASKKVFAAIVEKQMKKGPLMRILTRPVIPRDL